MRHKLLNSIMLAVVFILICLPASFAQPLFTCTLTNDVQVSGTVYEVDIYMLSRDVAPIQLAALSMGFTINNSVVNGGTLVASYVPGSSQLTNTAQINNVFNATSVSGALRVIKIAGNTPPGAGNGSMISNVAPGTKIGRLRLTSDVGFATGSLMNIAWEFTLYATKVNAYVGTVNTLLGGTGSANTGTDFFALSVINETLPIELNSFKSNVNERQVNLSWTTKTEVNSNKFEIERSLVSTNGSPAAWGFVGAVPASGNTNSPKSYSYTEKNLQAGKYQYRLKLVDNNGSYKYSEVIGTEVTLPKTFEVSQNYPNPFNPSTRINYSLPNDARVTLEVYNITGERIGQLVNEEQSAGYYTVNFSSYSLYRSIASGVYIYKVTAVDKVTGKSFSSIKKMMLLK
ncbi:MAG: T9SS type A sorting domain-containing protein [Ignavibacteriaceae bacterium]|nr:T9SS type A sorting domain-containing protein [Ignavibacteriaceae bacterium]